MIRSRSLLHEDQESTVKEIVIPPLVEPTRSMVVLIITRTRMVPIITRMMMDRPTTALSGKSYYKKPVAPLEDKERKENTKDSSQAKNLLEKAISLRDNNNILIRQVNNEVVDTKDAVVELAQFVSKQNAILVELIQMISTNAQDSIAGSMSASVAPQNTPVAVANAQPTASSTPGVTSAQPASAPSDQTKVESTPSSGPVSGPPVATTLTVQRADSMVDDQSSVTRQSIGDPFAPRRIRLPTPVTTPVMVPVQNTSVEDTPGALLGTVSEFLSPKRVKSTKTTPAASPVSTLVPDKSVGDTSVGGGSNEMPPKPEVPESTKQAEILAAGMDSLRNLKISCIKGPIPDGVEPPPGVNLFHSLGF